MNVNNVNVVEQQVERHKSLCEPASVVSCEFSFPHDYSTEYLNEYSSTR